VTDVGSGGGIDRVAEARLAESSRLFTSDLSTAEFGLLEHTGFEPVDFVMGVSVFHIGFQPPRGLAAGEYQVLTQAMYTARENALSRLVAEAAKVGADGVVGVRLGYHSHGEDSIEFTALGTAIRHTGGGPQGAAAPAPPGGYRRPDGQPFTSHLDVKDFYQLLTVGWFPVAFVLGVCVYHVGVQGFRQTMRQAFVNAELPQWTQAFYDAREIAMARLQAEAERAGAGGVVGVSSVTSEWVWGGHTLEFFVSGTGVRRIGTRQASPPALVVPV
jgi:uncharacterized protein YbjQ (UPF0145 family)